MVSQLQQKQTFSLLNVDSERSKTMLHDFPELWIEGIQAKF